MRAFIVGEMSRIEALRIFFLLALYHYVTTQYSAHLQRKKIVFFLNQKEKILHSIFESKLKKKEDSHIHTENNGNRHHTEQRCKLIKKIFL
jgi:hypothetical protein